MDVLKAQTLVTPVVRTFFPYLQSSRSLIIMQVLTKRPTFFGRECLAHQIKNFLERGWT